MALLGTDVCTSVAMHQRALDVLLRAFTFGKLKAVQQAERDISLYNKVIASPEAELELCLQYELLGNNLETLISRMSGTHRVLSRTSRMPLGLQKRSIAIGRAG